MSTNFAAPLAVVTGATSGVGVPLAIGLARAGRPLLLGVRDPGRGERAAAAVRAAVPGAPVDHAPLDLASLASVRAFAAGLAGADIGLLVLNAGVMTTSRQETQDGFELMMGTNALAHAALAGLLLERLARTPGARIVVQSSEVHRHGRVDLDDLQAVRRFRPLAAYNASKLALHVLGWSSTGAAGSRPWSPSRAGSTRARPRRHRLREPAQRLVMAVGNRLIGQTPEEGARAALLAALDPDVPGAATGRYVTPAAGPACAAPRGSPTPIRTCSTASWASACAGARRISPGSRSPRRRPSPGGRSRPHPPPGPVRTLGTWPRSGSSTSAASPSGAARPWPSRR
jgi:NAD(P)-dependent dehydrogenase (short-subunit alcohol dehydrogenase family)